MPQELPEELGSATPARVSMQFRPQAGSAAAGGGSSSVQPVPLPAQPVKRLQNNCRRRLPQQSNRPVQKAE